MATKIGETQRHCLQSLIDHKGWHSGRGWSWNGIAGTTRIMESLHKRGLVDKNAAGPLEFSGGQGKPSGVYTINAAGRKALRDGQ